jgi:hypothetical protein
VIKVFIPYKTSQITPARMIAPIRSQSNETAIPAIGYIFCDEVPAVGLGIGVLINELPVA